MNNQMNGYPNNNGAVNVNGINSHIPPMSFSPRTLPASPWFRLGLPLGSALILVAVMDTAMNFFSAWMDLGGVILFHIFNPEYSIGVMTIGWTLLVVIWITSNLILLWYGVILKGSQAFLQAWIITTLLCAIVVVFVWIYVLREYFGDWLNFFSELYSFYTFLLTNSYIIYVAIQCLYAMRSNEPLDPIGKGFSHIFKFYRDDPGLAAKFLLISELVFIGEYIFTRQVLQAIFNREGMGHEADNSGAIIAEEYALRIIRFVIVSIGLYIIVKGKLPALRYWGLLYLGTILASLCIFLYLLIVWKAEHPLFTIGYYMVFLVNLVYRAGILFVVMKVAQPYIASGNSFLTLQES